jgi:putative endonuclease
VDERLYYVYILASRSKVLYTGVTNYLLRRVQEHRGGMVPGFTTQYRIHRLVHFEMSRDVRVSIAREKEIKGCRRAKKIALIEETDPRWQDLAEGSFGRYPRKADPSLRSGKQFW